MKKKLSFIVATLLMISLTACGDDSSSSGDTSKNFSYEISNVVLNFKTDSMGRKHYDGIVEINNNGEVPLYLDNCKYDFENAEGHLVKTVDDVNNIPDVIQPGEKGYFFPDYDLFDESITETDGLKLNPHTDIGVATEKYHNLDVEDVSVRIESLGNSSYPIVTGRVVNNTKDNVDNPRIAVVFYDKDGVPFGIDYTYGSNTGAGEKTSFEINCGMTESLCGRPEEDYNNYKIYAVDYWYLQMD